MIIQMDFDGYTTGMLISALLAEKINRIDDILRNAPEQPVDPDDPLMVARGELADRFNANLKRLSADEFDRLFY